MADIHPTALVDEQAEIATDVSIGAYTVIGPHVKIGSGTKIGPHVVIDGHTTIGEQNEIFQFCSLGAVPQDKKYRDEPTELIIGNHNTIREFCSFNLGTVQGGGVTRIGDDNWIMAYVHLAHDCKIGNHTIFANNASLAGHVTIEDWVILGGFSLVHQFCVIGQHAMTAFASGVAQDVPPFVMAAGYRTVPSGINSEGLKRRGFSKEAIAQVKQAYKILYRQGLPFEEAKAQILERAQTVPELSPFIDFFGKANRGIIR
ncbi:acyl-ACP--UDP-N-acetylglucosamine O-acyltransferase [Neisseria sp. Ec49-e6-T10]|uniref:acyl-ACP--UDP-N-acetylglucosamine O-acyltransferase n=1 Tax=Neisseria sp. Ec49-e6-T10 TaxID=3140744 RepID=UPI003EBD7475